MMKNVTLLYLHGCGKNRSKKLFLLIILVRMGGVVVVVRIQ